MTKRRTILTLIALLAFVTVTLTGCNLFGSGTNIPTETQALGDQDITFGGHSMSVAGELHNWAGHGYSTWVYTITIDPNCKTTTTYVKPAAPFVIVSTCNNGVWVIVGTTDAKGSITAAAATPYKK